MAGSDQLEASIIDFFQIRGMEAEKIDEEEDSKTPDFLVQYGGMKILIELKMKLENPLLAEHREEALAKGEIYEQVEVLAHSNAVSKVAKEATEQLEAKKKVVGADMCFIYFIAMSDSPGTLMEKIEATLYGTKEIITMGGVYANQKPRLNAGVQS